jgi:hypothetical protein
MGSRPKSLKVTYAPLRAKTNNFTGFRMGIEGLMASVGFRRVCWVLHEMNRRKTESVIMGWM